MLTVSDRIVNILNDKIMKKLVLISLIFAACAAGIGYAVAAEKTVTAESVSAQDPANDQSLGNVTLCDGNGDSCDIVPAYKDSRNGRIYVSYNSVYLYAQKSNDSRWEYMVRVNGSWLYFSF